MFSFYNTKSRKIQRWEQAKENPITIYCCGPTVYAPAHIGNIRLYIFLDIVRRILKLSKYKINMAMNITDIDDKTIRSVYEQDTNSINKNQEKTMIDLKRYTRIHEKKFFEDIHSVGIQKIEHYPRATENLQPMVALIQSLINKGFAYSKNNSIYFSVKKFQNYGLLSGIDKENMKLGSQFDSDEYSKNDIRDFVLWKTKKEKDISFLSPFGEGRPGWHLECSAMIQNTFRSSIDFHVGGVDLIFPHHENEIAQSKCGYDNDFVHNWLHCEHLLVENNKMSKSLNNVYVIDDIIQKGFHPIALRYLLFSVHYRQKLNFTFESLAQADRTLKKILRIYNLVLEKNVVQESRIENVLLEMKNKVEEFQKEFLSSCTSNFNLPKALSSFHSFLTWVNANLDRIISISIKNCILNGFAYFDSVLNILQTYPYNYKTAEISNVLTELLEKREKARLEKQYSIADEIRKAIEKRGYQIEDRKEGAVLIPIAK